MTDLACAIVSAPREQQHFLTRNFKGLICDVVQGTDRIYLLSFVAGRGTNEQFIDPVDGALLVSLHFFSNESDARRWVAQDIALRTAHVPGVQ